MNRPWKIWLTFGSCLGVLLAAMGWVSLTVLRLDRAQAQAQQQAEQEEKVRLALWRMDSMLAPILAQESARPYFVYNAFYAAERAYGNMFSRPEQGESLVPSPLLTQVFTNVLLHFQYGPGGQLTSPQVPVGDQRTLAEARFVARVNLDLAASRLRSFERLTGQPATTAPGLLNRDVLLSVAPSPQPGDNLLTANFLNAPAQQRLLAQSQNRASPLPGSRPTPAAEAQTLRNDEELQARASSVQRAFDVNVQNTLANFPSGPRLNVGEGPLKALWFGEALVLVRRVIVQGQEYTQGCWLDWPGLQRWLLEGVSDLLPRARLDPLTGNGADPHARLLASLPVRVEPGEPGAAPDAAVSPVRFALAFAWVCVVVATLAVAFLLHGAVSLSERRAAFVSAVTHELRTPLTTFKMYSEMLAAGMVPDPANRARYLSTLSAEANRLEHLVENVLAYARLERGSARRRVEEVPLGALLDRVKPRLIERAERASLLVGTDGEEAALRSMVRVDVLAVEQVLFNLVDNACKYAAPDATDKRLHLEAGLDGNTAVLRVRDHGRGIPRDVVKRLFQPFSKSAQEAAHSAPGVGLGLALCRRLSRSLGGDLELDRSVTDGACLVLRLPRSPRVDSREDLTEGRGEVGWVDS